MTYGGLPLVCCVCQSHCSKHCFFFFLLLSSSPFFFSLFLLPSASFFFLCTINEHKSTTQINNTNQRTQINNTCHKDECNLVFRAYHQLSNGVRPGCIQKASPMRLTKKVKGKPRVFFLFVNNIKLCVLCPWAGKTDATNDCVFVVQLF